MTGNSNKLFISSFALTLSPDSLWAILVDVFFPSGSQSQNLIKSPKFHFVNTKKQIPIDLTLKESVP